MKSPCVDLSFAAVAVTVGGAVVMKQENDGNQTSTSEEDNGGEEKLEEGIEREELKGINANDEENIGDEESVDDEITIGEDGVPTFRTKTAMVARTVKVDTLATDTAAKLPSGHDDDGHDDDVPRKPDPPAEHVCERVETSSQPLGRGEPEEGQGASPETARTVGLQVPFYLVAMSAGVVLFLVLAVVVMVMIFVVAPKDRGEEGQALPTSPNLTKTTNSPTRAPFQNDPSFSKTFEPSSSPGRPTISMQTNPPTMTSKPIQQMDPCPCAPCPCNSPFVLRGQELTGYGWISHPSLDLSADGDILVTREGGNDGGGDLVRFWRYDRDRNGSWVALGQPLPGPGTFGLSHGASVLSLSANGNFLVLGTNILQFWTYDPEMDAWWGPGAGDAVGQPSRTGVPTPDGDSYSSSYSVTMSEDTSRFVMVGDAMNLQPNVAHVFDRQNIADWIPAGDSLFNEQPNDVNFAATISGDGTTVALGAPDNNAGGFNRAGHVRILRWNDAGGNWVQMGQTLEGSGPLVQLGNQITLSSDGLTLAAQTLTGVRIFHFDESTNEWLLNGPEIMCRPNETTWPQHYSTMSGNGRVVAVAGCPGLGSAVDKDGMFGAFGNVRVFELDEDTNQRQRLGESDLYGIDQAESRVAALALSHDGLVLAVGSTAGSFYTNEFGFQERRAGIVRVFARP